MLSNEQRAHDLAVAAMQVQIITVAIDSKGTDTRHSIDELYLEAYDRLLEVMNKRFS